MANQLSVVVFFNSDRLDEIERFNREAKSAIVTAGIDTIRSLFPGTRIAQPNTAACSVSVSGPHDVMMQLVSYLEEHKQFASYVVDGPVIHSAHR